MYALCNIFVALLCMYAFKFYKLFLWSRFSSSWPCLGIVVSLIEEDGLQVELKSRDGCTPRTAMNYFANVCRLWVVSGGRSNVDQIAICSLFVRYKDLSILILFRWLEELSRPKATSTFSMPHDNPIPEWLAGTTTTSWFNATSPALTRQDLNHQMRSHLSRSIDSMVVLCPPPCSLKYWSHSRATTSVYD